MEELRKDERKNRDEFRKLMEEHVAAGILNAKTNWRDYCINIKDFAAYLVVSSNTSGSTAKDLFTDVMDELEKQYLDDKSQIKDAVRMAEIGLTSAWTLDDFKVAIAKYISSPPISDTNLKEITASSKWEDWKSLFGDRQVASFAFIDLELVTRLQGPLENDS
ncbi:pre-mRNA-processing protein 40A-like isoform X4 [Capsicum annuum]|uniref:pre-mRNA-processing protein 40A-like isoform X4 n=1 Tax=Capsicum annuum TaxID=4072 RepID=UPI001FB15449|nr:pre-mRNA-processing protein 40A-like isoform X4 [Capsicum annuum]